MLPWFSTHVSVRTFTIHRQCFLCSKSLTRKVPSKVGKYNGDYREISSGVHLALMSNYITRNHLLFLLLPVDLMLAD